MNRVHEIILKHQLIQRVDEDEANELIKEFKKEVIDNYKKELIEAINESKERQIVNIRCSDQIWRHRPVMDISVINRIMNEVK